MDVNSLLFISFIIIFLQKQRVHMICYVLIVQETCHENIETTL